MRVHCLNFKHHPQGPYFFKDLSFELQAGAINALHGKNGAGKSVLLHILSQNIEDGCFTGNLPTEKATLMSQQFDQTLVGPFTFLENLEFSLLKRFPSPFKRLKAPPLPTQFSSLLERFQIDVNIPVHKLSGGQRQILALLMKLQRKPQTLLLDEPTATLDEQNATLVFEFLKSLEGVTMLIVCHDQELMMRYTTGKQFRIEVNAAGVRELHEI